MHRLRDDFAPTGAQPGAGHESPLDVDNEKIDPVEVSPPSPDALTGLGLGSNAPWSSRAASVSNVGSSEREEMSDLKCEVIVSWLHQQQLERLWYEGTDEEGIILKKGKGIYACCPEQIGQGNKEFHKAVEALNVKVSIGFYSHSSCSR